jgi:D-alanyl-D-alanine carboxypeptidase
MRSFFAGIGAGAAFCRRSARIAVLALAGLMSTLAHAAAAPDAAIVMDASTGRILYEESADDPRYPASLTKMMTLYIVFEMIEKGKLDIDADLIITEHAAAAQPSKLGLKPGEKIPLREAIKALVVKSANDVAISIAENLAGTEDKFARYMTRRARQLGMKSTTFKNASGLPDTAQRTTARDLLTLALRLQDDFPEHYKLFKTSTFTWRGRRHRNHNTLLFDFAGVDGIKTGYTRASGFNLASSVRRDGKHVVAVVLGGESARARNTRMRRLLTDGLAKASTEKTRKPAPRQDAPLVASSSKKKKPAPAKPSAEIVAAAASETLAPGKKQSLGAPKAGRSDNTEPAAEAGWTASAAAPGSDATTLAESVSPPRPNGPFHVQVGAYVSASEAHTRLTNVSIKASSLIAGHEAVAIPFAKDNTTWYRARFAGFDEGKAKSTCMGLKKQKIDCVVMRAE